MCIEDGSGGSWLVIGSRFGVARWEMSLDFNCNSSTWNNAIDLNYMLKRMLPFVIVPSIDSVDRSPWRSWPIFPARHSPAYAVRPESHSRAPVLSGFARAFVYGALCPLTVWM